MKYATLFAVAALAFVLVAPATPVAAESGPCPSNCTPPEPCGWAPDVRKDPVGWVGFWADCAEDLTG